MRVRITKSRFLSLLMALVTVFSVMCVFSISVSALDNAKIDIVKLDKDTNEGIKGAVIVLYDGNKHEIDRKTTNNSGFCQFKITATGRYSFKEEGAPKGYVTNESTYEFAINNDNQAVSTTLYAVSLKSLDYITTIRSLDSNSSPMPSCKIAIYDVNKKKIGEVTTDSNGQADYNMPEPGTYYYRIVEDKNGNKINDTYRLITVKEPKMSPQTYVLNAYEIPAIVVSNPAPSQPSYDPPVQQSSHQEPSHEPVQQSSEQQSHEETSAESSVENSQESSEESMEISKPESSKIEEWRINISTDFDEIELLNDKQQVVSVQRAKDELVLFTVNEPGKYFIKLKVAGQVSDPYEIQVKETDEDTFLSIYGKPVEESSDEPSEESEEESVQESSEESSKEDSKEESSKIESSEEESSHVNPFVGFISGFFTFVIVLAIIGGAGFAALYFLLLKPNNMSVKDFIADAKTGFGDVRAKLNKPKTEKSDDKKDSKNKKSDSNDDDNKKEDKPAKPKKNDESEPKSYNDYSENGRTDIDDDNDDDDDDDFDPADFI